MLMKLTPGIHFFSTDFWFPCHTKKARRLYLMNPLTIEQSHLINQLINMAKAIKLNNKNLSLLLNFIFNPF